MKYLPSALDDMFANVEKKMIKRAYALYPKQINMDVFLSLDNDQNQELSELFELAFQLQMKVTDFRTLDVLFFT